MQQLSMEKARLVPQDSWGDEFHISLINGLEVWTTLAHREMDEMDVYTVPGGLVARDQADGAELHLTLEPGIAVDGKAVAIAVFMHELAIDQEEPW